MSYTNQIVKINEAEGIFYSAFDKFLCDDKQLVLENAEMERLWDTIGIRGKGKFCIHFLGKVSLEDYDKVLCFISVPPQLTIEGSAYINGKKQPLFAPTKGASAPLELTSESVCKQGEKVVLEKITLSISGSDETAMVLLSWLGVSASWREPQLEEVIDKIREEKFCEENWCIPDVVGRMNHNLLFTEAEGEWIKERILQNPQLVERIKNNTKEAVEIVPEQCIREFVPVAEHMYRFVRMRDRGRPSFEHHILNLAIAGWLFDNSVYSNFAARMIVALLPMKWFEGPTCCMEGSDFHHVCFTEDHLTSEVCLAMGFLGGVFTKEGESAVVDKIQGAWNWIWKKCCEQGYRSFMNQGIVGNRGALIGACYLKRFYKKYEDLVQHSYKRHTQIVENYLSIDGHCVEGGNYFEYSFTTSILLWHIYAKEQGIPIEQVVPNVFKKSGNYQEAIISSVTNSGQKIPINCGNAKEVAPLLLLFMKKVCRYEEADFYLQNQLKGESIANSFELLFLEYYQEKSKAESPKVEKEKEIIFQEEGLASWRFSQGKFLVLAERNPYTAHFHEDRGSIILEAEGEILLPDLGTTSYANPVCLLMEKKEYHNLACPSDLTMRVASETGIMAARSAAYNLEEILTKEDMRIPEACLEVAESGTEGCHFRVETGMLYGEHIEGNREGWLNWVEKKLTLKDSWIMPEAHPLLVTFLSYHPWEVHLEKVTSGRMTLCTESKDALSFEQEESMVDWKGSPIYVLRIRVDASKNHQIKTEISW